MKKNKISRREFVKSTGSTALATAALSSCSTFEKVVGTSRNPSEYVGGWKVDESNKFDFIIVGSGAGGGPLAAGLAKSGFTVLLIEAGGTSSNVMSDTPVFHAKASEDKLLNWSFFSKMYGDESRFKSFERLNSKFQKKEEGIYYPRASGLGGCTRVNALINLYPDVADWNNLSKKLGDDPRFSASEMAKVYHRIQAGHSKDGWLKLSQASQKTLIKDRFLIRVALAAFAADGFDSKGALKDLLMGLHINPNKLMSALPNSSQNLLSLGFDALETLDGAAVETIRKKILQDESFKLNPNDPGYANLAHKVNGIFNIPFNATDGIRNGVREYIIETEANKQNQLFIKPYSLCTRILFDSLDKTKAIGIEFIEGAHAYKADVMNQDQASSSYVRKAAFAGEIILSGGAFNTPQLLMLSGVGPDAHLPSSIPRIKNLPGVGKNLQDRYEVTVVSELKEPLETLKDCTFARDNDFNSDPCWQDYLKDPKNHIYGTNGVALSMIRRSTAEKPTPDLAVFGIPGYFKGYYPGYAADTIPQKVGDPNYFTWSILKGHTKNHAGEVKLKSDDPKDTPNINFKYFHDENNGLTEDLHAVFNGLKIARNINSKMGSKYFKDEVYPGSKIQSEQDLKSWIMKEAWGHHASCTNKMGLASDPMAVVDQNFKVHGLQNLRIVDASVFPDIPGLFIMLPTLMMSEKAKEIILQDYGRG